MNVSFIMKNMKNMKSIYFCLIVIILTIFIFLWIFCYKKIRESFTSENESVQNFLQIQNTINRNKVFDIKLMQHHQVSQEEIDYFNRNGRWHWSQKTKDLYLEALEKNPYVRTYSPDELNYVMTVYNEQSILKILSYQSKEGEFLLNGILIPTENKLPIGFGDFAYNSQLMDGSLKNDVVKCNMNNYELVRISNTGKYGGLGEQIKMEKNVDYNDLENIIPGFSFLNSPCNPCTNIDETTNYPCAFQIKTKKGNYFSDNISNIWKYLWFG